MPERRVLFLARSLGHGGAERQLVVLAAALQRRGYRVSVATLYAGGLHEDELRAQGIPVHSLEKRGRWDVAGFAWRLYRLLRTLEPDILHSYLVVPNVLASWARLARWTKRAVWGVRASHLEWSHYDYATRLTFELSRHASRYADLIIANSEAGRRFHVARGYPEDRTIVIPNGIDTARFRPEPAARIKVREAWGVPADSPLVGLIGRLDPMKGHETFLRAAASVLGSRPDVRFVIVGAGEPEYTRLLRERTAELGIAHAVHFIEPGSDAPALYAALDVLASASEWGEGFSNVIGEAMASELNCVVTDCGDSAGIVADIGIVVPRGEYAALARGICTILSWDPGERTRRGREGRRRIEAQYSVEALVERTTRAFASLT